MRLRVDSNGILLSITRARKGYIVAASVTCLNLTHDVRDSEFVYQSPYMFLFYRVVARNMLECERILQGHQ